MTTIHLVPHTHWDREWYRSFQSFRMQLVDVVDRVMAMLEADPEFAFTLDGQLATIDDYLEIRPERAQRIAGYVRDGRLAIGPWQILMDEFLVSGETIVRNLEFGWHRATELGQPMRVGYLPDMFGHVAQMPQILRRAGLADAVVWRGVPAAIDRHAFRWEAPDGSSVRAEYLPAGYGNAAYLFAIPDRPDAAIDRFVAWAEPWFGADPVLAMYGTDHMAPAPDLAERVRHLNRRSNADGSRIELETLTSYLGAAPALREDAPRWRGELRSGARANLLMGVASARIDIKQAAGRAECLLERYAEPLTAIHLPADAWPAPFLRLAWRRVIENSAHDSICGCSIDPVAAQVLVRFAEAEQVAGSLARRVAHAVGAGAPRGSVVALNPSPFERVDLVEADLAIPDTWESVALELADGRRVATQLIERNEPILFEGLITGADVDELFRRFHGREIFDHAWNGFRLDAESLRLTLDVDTEPEPAWLDVEEMKGEIEVALLAAPKAEWQVRFLAHPRRRLLAALPLPALGWTAARPVEGSGDAPDPVRSEPRGLANGRLAVRVADDGTLDLEAADGARVSGVARIVDGGDFGDSYNYAPPADDRLIEGPTSVGSELLERGPLRGRLRVTRRYEWPVGVEVEGSARTSGAVRTEIVTDVELRAGEPFVRLAISFDNRSDDHRVRCHVPLPRPAATSFAEGQFAVVERGTTPEGGYGEEPLATYPAHGWVDAGGMAVLLEHLTEYELLDAPGNGSGSELALTTLRSTGLISRNENPYRRDPAGPEIAIPAAQLRGPWRFGFALLPHAGSWQDVDVPRAAEGHRLGFLAAPGAAAPEASTWPPVGAGAPAFEVRGEGVVLTALRRRDGGWLEARLVNQSDRTASAEIAGGGLQDARECDLLGNPGEVITVTDGTLRVDIGQAEIRTLQLRRSEAPLTTTDGLLDVAGPRQSR